MGRPRRNGKDSPIDSKQKALAEQEEKLRRRMQELQQMIEEAPRVAEEVQKRRRQELVIRAQPTRRAESPNSLFDKRYDANVLPRRRTKSLRAERQEARLKFFALCALFAICVLLIWARMR
jgi:hypothetical protein